MTLFCLGRTWNILMHAEAQQKKHDEAAPVHFTKWGEHNVAVETKTESIKASDGPGWSQTVHGGVVQDQEQSHSKVPADLWIPSGRPEQAVLLSLLLLVTLRATWGGRRASRSISALAVIASDIAGDDTESAGSCSISMFANTQCVPQAALPPSCCFHNQTKQFNFLSELNCNFWHVATFAMLSWEHFLKQLFEIIFTL